MFSSISQINNDLLLTPRDIKKDTVLSVCPPAKRVDHEPTIGHFSKKVEFCRGKVYTFLCLPFGHSHFGHLGVTNLTHSCGPEHMHTTVFRPKLPLLDWFRVSKGSSRRKSKNCSVHECAGSVGHAASVVPQGKKCRRAKNACAETLCQKKTKLDQIFWSLLVFAKFSKTLRLGSNR